jgi:hypothetical protein
MQTENILLKIQKLLAKAASTDSLEESESLVLKAQALLQEYNLDMLQVENLELKEEGIREDSAGYQYEWERLLVNRIAINNFCKTMSFPSENKINVIGKSNNISVVIYLYKFFHQRLLELSIKSYIEMCKERCNGLEPSKAVKKNYLKEYLIGGVNGIGSKMEEQKYNAQKESSNLTSLMIINDKKVEEYYKSAYPHTRQMRSVRITANSTAYSKGFNDGKNINTYNAVTSGAKQLK